MVSCSQVFSSFPSHPGAPFYCRVIDKERGFEIELFDRATEKSWACSVTPDTLDLHADATTKIPLDKVKSFVKIGLIALGAGQESQDAVLDMIEQPEELVIMQLRLRFGLGGCYWNPTLNFMLDKATAQQREKLELQASITTMASELSNKATTVATSVEQTIQAFYTKAYLFFTASW